MKIVGVLVASDRVHIGVKSLAVSEAVLAEGVALPLRERLNDLHVVIHALDVEGDRALDAVQGVVESALALDEERRGDAREIKLYSEIALEEILYLLYSDLGLAYVEQRLITFRNED